MYRCIRYSVSRYVNLCPIFICNETDKVIFRVTTDTHTKRWHSSFSDGARKDDMYM